jgi:putative tryptophan/tyrosine transport system substrate-binding protein
MTPLGVLCFLPMNACSSNWGQPMKRRQFIRLVGGAAAWPTTTRAQRSGRLRRIGLLYASHETPISLTGHRLFLYQLRQLGFTEGQDVKIERRALDLGSADSGKLVATAKELVHSNIDVMVTFGPEMFIQAAAAASASIPIVMIAVNFDPIARGYIASLARPGGNITGVTYRQAELASKQLELMTQAFPDRTRLSILWDAQSADQFGKTEGAAQSMPLQLHSMKLASLPYNFQEAFRSVAQERAQVLLVLSSPFFAPQRSRIANLAIEYHLPAMFIFKSYVQAGGLMSYGVDYLRSYRRTADYVAKILRGATPAELPVEEIERFKLVINLTTAKAIGVEFPTSILLRADEVIE